jgi:CRP-like cAMP-binding protein
MTAAQAVPDPRRIARASFAGQLTTDQQREVLRLGPAVVFGDGETLIGEGDPESHVYLLVRGWVKVLGTIGGHREAVLAFRVCGDLVGELAAFDGQPRIATVRAVGPCVAVRIDRATFLAFLRRHPDVAVAVQSSVAAKLRAATRRRVEFATCSTRVRVARILTDLSRSYGAPTPKGRRLGVRLNQKELAALAGTTEVTVQRVLAELRTLGALVTGYREILIADADLLASVADDTS